MTYSLFITTYALFATAATLYSLPATATAALLSAARSLYTALLSALFGDSLPVALPAVSPADVDSYSDTADGVYQTYFNGYSTVEYLSAARVINRLAFGYTVAFTVDSQQPGIESDYFHVATAQPTAQQPTAQPTGYGDSNSTQGSYTRIDYTATAARIVYLNRFYCVADGQTQYEVFITDTAGSIVHILQTADIQTAHHFYRSEIRAALRNEATVQQPATVEPTVEPTADDYAAIALLIDDSTVEPATATACVMEPATTAACRQAADSDSDSDSSHSVTDTFQTADGLILQLDPARNAWFDVATETLRFDDNLDGHPVNAFGSPLYGQFIDSSNAAILRSLKRRTACPTADDSAQAPQQAAKRKAGRPRLTVDQIRAQFTDTILTAYAKSKFGHYCRSERAACRKATAALLRAGLTAQHSNRLINDWLSAVALGE